MSLTIKNEKIANEFFAMLTLLFDDFYSISFQQYPCILDTPVTGAVCSKSIADIKNTFHIYSILGPLPRI